MANLICLILDLDENPVEPIEVEDCYAQVDKTAKKPKKKKAKVTQETTNTGTIAMQIAKIKTKQPTKFFRFEQRQWRRCVCCNYQETEKEIKNIDRHAVFSYTICFFQYINIHASGSLFLQTKYLHLTLKIRNQQVTSPP